ncbi:MAG: 50S ribosomal protein L4 [Clostridiales bacterium]|jgi:large subunit ribosomal protein L4|nr:50S ribosomal protein L4 [Clostridiales bacterium]
MANVDLYKMDGSVVGKIELNDEIFGIQPNPHVLHQAVVQYLANQRQGTKSTKTRAEVRGGGAKPRPQKGTGRSRQGTIRAPQWTGGGVVFAPKPRDFSFKLNKKVKRLALKSALSSKVADGKMLVLEELTLPEIKTKEMIKVLDNIKVGKALMVLGDDCENEVLSARNIPGIKTCGVNNINVYDIVKYDYLIATKEAVDKMQEVYI